MLPCLCSREAVLCSALPGSSTHDLKKSMLPCLCSRKAILLLPPPRCSFLDFANALSVFSTRCLLCSRNRLSPPMLDSCLLTPIRPTLPLATFIQPLPSSMYCIFVRLNSASLSIPAHPPSALISSPRSSSSSPSSVSLWRGDRAWRGGT